MAKDTAITWCDHTFNPWWGCARVSPGCENCYAEAWAKRYRVEWGVNKARRLFGIDHWKEPLKWNEKANKAGVRRRVFCASMADVFEDRADLAPERAKLWSLIEATPALDWLLLTKRPENMLTLAPEQWRDGWPMNVWAGTSVEDQKRTDRILDLIRVPAVIRFLSVEPMLEPVTLGLIGTVPKDVVERYSGVHEHIHWVIVGGESGHGARPFDMLAARAIVLECQEVGVRVHVKQMGTLPIDGLAGCTPLFRHKKGGDITEWPPELQIREYPDAVIA